MPCKKRFWEDNEYEYDENDEVIGRDQGHVHNSILNYFPYILLIALKFHIGF